MSWGTTFNYLVLIVVVLGHEALTSPIPHSSNILNNVVKTEEYEPISVFNDEVTVTIAQGTVVGSMAEDGDYVEFHGIPYADSTSGLHRFKAPRPPPSFEDTFIANRRNIKCVRALGVGYEGTEDCLVANVYTPGVDTTSRLPVMVWIKGKQLDRVDEPELSFKNFVEQDVVVVSLNYRESVFGFLCLGTETAPGNAGLKDIIAGLQWVKQNIEQFGGNSDDITLFGHGSGAAAIDLVTLSPMANGLVNKAIAQSGTAMAPWAVSRDNLEYAIQVAEALGHEVVDIQQLSEIFARSSVVALMSVINELDLTKNTLAFAPCIERQDLEGETPFLVKTPSEAIADGEYLAIPFIAGFVDNEGTLRAEEAFENDWLERMDNSFYEFLQPDLKFQNNADRTTMAERIRRFYFDDDQIDVSTFGDYITYHGETMILVSSIREIRARAQRSFIPTYLYQFSYRGNLVESLPEPFDVETAAHSEELAYLFLNNPEQASERDLSISAILVERWTNFAKTGNPSSTLSPAIWQPFTNANSFYLRILASDEISSVAGAPVEMSLTNPHSETIAFWDGIYEEHFLDAESNWDLTERNDDDEEETEDVETPDNDGDEDGEGSGDDDDDDDDEDDEDEDNSASTAVGYTFVVVSLFTLLNYFHCSQLVS